MRLDRSTYEAWLLDRIEGMLTAGQERELDAFLLANPDLDPAIRDLPHVDGGAEAFPMKAALHRRFPPSGAPDAARLNDFLAARLEGDLSAEQEMQLDRYLYEHPEVARDAAWMAHTKLEQEKIVFSDKASIARHFPPRGMPDTHRLVDFLIAKAEGDLDAEQLAALEQYLSDHTGSTREQQVVAATFIEREAVVFPHKAALKKRAVRVLPLWSRLAAAASIALLLSAGWWLLRADRPVEDADIAQVEHAVPQKAAEQELPAVEPQVNTPEHAVAQVNKAATNVTHNAAVVPKHANTSVGEPASTEHVRHTDPPLEVLEPIQRIARAAIKDDALPQWPVDEGAWGLAQATATTGNGPTSLGGEGEDLGMYLANRLRRDVLDAPRRSVELDGTDAFAMADKAIGAITAGQGGVDVQRSVSRERIQVRLGRNFSLSTSRSR